MLTGCKPLEQPGYFLPPTVLVSTTEDMRVVREEIFGPVLVAMPYEDLDEVVKRANDTIYGLGASIWTRDFSTYRPPHGSQAACRHGLGELP